MAPSSFALIQSSAPLAFAWMRSITRLRIAHSSGSGLPSVRCSTEMNVAKQQAVSDPSKLTEIGYPLAMHPRLTPSQPAVAQKFAVESALLAPRARLAANAILMRLLCLLAP